MTTIHPPVQPDPIARQMADIERGAAFNDRPRTETDAVNALVDMQRANSEAIDPNGARRLVRSLVALGLLRFE